MNGLKIGLFGFGCVGQGLYDILHHNEGFRAEVVKICVKDPHKARPLPANYFTFNPDEILQNPDINLVVELINDADEAYRIVTTALRRGKTVVTANKKMLAEHLEELVALQEEYGTPLLYEASVCGSIPIIRNLEEYYDNELLHSVCGIINGSSNYILSKVFNEGQPYAAALKKAQALGFAETDPTLDVGGFDARNKLCILTAHAYGLFVKPDEVFTFGIQSLSAPDFQFAREKGLKLKLLAQVQKVDGERITAFVMPQLVDPFDYLHNVENEYNGVTVQAAFADRQFFMGKGAGGHPTGSAVLSDLSASRYGYKYEYKKLAQHKALRYTTGVTLEVYVRYHDEADLELLQLVDIAERYSGRHFRYVVGEVSLAHLLSIQSELATRDVFIARTGRKVELVQEEVLLSEETLAKSAL
jgi:homoserine dehydrogenase